MSTNRGPILLVDDTPSILEMLSTALRLKGYAVITAVNGREALQTAIDEQPQLIITDILMPQMDGFALVHALRENPLTRHIKIIFLSATFTASQDQEFGLSLGASHFIKKPIDTEILLHKVNETLTQEQEPVDNPIDISTFYQKYKQRLNNKLQQKNAYISQTERLLKTLPTDQKQSFELSLEQAVNDRDNIQAELNRLQKLLDTLPGFGTEL